MASNTATPLQTPTSAATDFQAQEFFVKQLMYGKIRTAILVQVQAVHGGGVGAPPTVDVLPMVHQIDGAGNVVPHVTVYKRPVFRLQGGTSAVIADPVVGDIGWMCFAQRDISAAVSSKKPSPPGSRRKFSFADGVYFGAFLGATPTQYLELASGGVTIQTPNTVAVNGQSATVTTTAAISLGAVTTVGITAATTNITSATNITGATDINGVTIDISGNVTAPVGGSINATVHTADSVQGSGSGGSPIELVGDSASPGASMYYGTDSGGAKGFHPVSGGGGGSISVTDGTNTELSVTTLHMSGASVSSGGAGVAIASVNITPDTHPVSPTIYDDEFESSTLAAKWVLINQGTSPTPTTGQDGSLVFTSSHGGTDQIYVVAEDISTISGTYTLQADVLLTKYTTANDSRVGMYIGFGTSTTKCLAIGIYSVTPAIFITRYNNPNSFSSGPFNNSFGTIWGRTPIHVYMQVQYDGTNLIFKVSDSGAPGSFITLYSETPAAFLGSLPTNAGIFVDCNSSTLPGIVNHFRRVA